MSPKSDPKKPKKHQVASDGFNRGPKLQNDVYNIATNLRKSADIPGRVKHPIHYENRSPNTKHKTPQLPAPGPTDMLQAEDLAKIFGGN